MGEGSLEEHRKKVKEQKELDSHALEMLHLPRGSSY